MSLALSSGELAVRQPVVGRAVKRLLDIGLSAAGLLLTAPLVALLAILVRLDSPGPAFYRQPRVGRRQRVFSLTKLRTMDEHGRVTRVGRLLRPTGLDELPQLWQVLEGKMSLIGPRPEEPHRAARWQQYLPHFSARHAVRPGLTGWAQINDLRGPAPIPERLRFDLEYVHGWSLSWDLRILLRTPLVLWRDTRRAWQDRKRCREPS